MMLMATRQRAMLKEMGIRIWQPEPVVPPTAVDTVTAPNIIATNKIAAHAQYVKAAVPFDEKRQAGQVAARQVVPVPVSVSVSAPVPGPAKALAKPQTNETNETSLNADSWRVGGLQTLYGEAIATPSGHGPATTNRWLLLLESPDSALQADFNPLAGDAGKLLDNMLRAAKLPASAVVMLAPLVRGSPGNSNNNGNNNSNSNSNSNGNIPTDHLSSQLADVLAIARPDVVLGMGRMAAQALLQSAEPLPRMRGYIHTLHGCQTIVTLDPAYLLRNPLDKAKAWDDLCLALSAVSASG